MTDENSGAAFPADEQPGRPSRLSLIAGATAGVIVLATVGAFGGWLLADGKGGAPQADGGTAVPAPSTVTSSAGPKRSTAEPVRTTTRGATSRPPAGQFALPDLVGQDFQQAREVLRKKNLGWHFEFGVAGDDRTVARTSPPANGLVKSGITVDLVVVGAAPPATIPSVVGLTCAEAGNRAVDNGLLPRYPLGDKGLVTRQDPEPTGQARWNDRISLYCGRVPADATASPTP